MGLGDSLYLQGVVRHLVACGQRLEVCTPWQDVFRPLAGKVDLSPFRRDRVDRVAHYIRRKRIQGTDQFADCCHEVGIREPVEFLLDWRPVNIDLVERIRRADKPAVIVQLPRRPMDRADGYGDDLLPDCRTLQRAINLLRRRAFIIQIGKGKPLFEFTGINLDLANRTSVSDMIDVAYASHGALGYCSFLAPLAESLKKPALFVWSRRGLTSNNDFIRTIKPPKILHRTSSRFVMDDCDGAQLSGAVDALCEQIGSPQTV